MKKAINKKYIFSFTSALIIVVVVCLLTFVPIGEQRKSVASRLGAKFMKNKYPSSVARNSDIIVETPRIGQKIVSPLTIKGEARGSWFFEGSFPIKIVDSAGANLAIGIAKADGEWMTDDFVPFTANIIFSGGPYPDVRVILMNDNPSGDESRAKYLTIPVSL